MKFTNSELSFKLLSLCERFDPSTDVMITLQEAFWKWDDGQPNIRGNDPRWYDRRKMWMLEELGLVPEDSEDVWNTCRIVYPKRLTTALLRYL